MSISMLIKRLKDIMRGDSGVDGDAQRLSQIVWILFLKIFDHKEEEWELENDYKPVIPLGYRWRDWASCTGEDGEPDKKKQLTGDDLINFVNNKLFPVLKGEAIKDENNEYVTLFNSDDPKAFFVRKFMEDSTNYMKNGVYLRQVINVFVEVSFDDAEERYAFNDIYETILKDLQAAGKAGEFYTPRALTSFVTEKVNPQIGENVADFACGTGGFLVEALKHLQAQVEKLEESKCVQESLHGIEWKPLPYMLCVANLLLHDVNNPNILHDNGLAKNVMELTSEDKYKVILMNPPFGGNVDALDLTNFPTDLRSSESADLFIAKILYSLKDEGRCGLILPDGFLFNDEIAKTNLKKKILSEFNLHTVIRLPKTVFAPYTDINTNLLFFDKTGATKEIWYYRLDMPEDQKRFNKTRPIRREHFEPVDEWWNNRVEIKDEREDESMTQTWKARKYSVEEIIERNYNLDLCGFPIKEEVVLSPEETIDNYMVQKKELEHKLSEATTTMKNYIYGNENIVLMNIKSLSDKITSIDNSFPNNMKKALLQAAIQGKLTEQSESDSSVDELLIKIKEEKDRLIKEKKISKEKALGPISDEEIPFDIPENWRWVKLANVSKRIHYGYTASAQPVGTAKLLRITDIQDNKVNWNEVPYCSPKESELRNYELHNRDIMIARTGGTIGKTYIVESLNEVAVFASYLIRVVPSDFINELYIKRYMESPCYWNQLIAKSSGTGQPNVNGVSLSNLYIPIPPLEEQERIVEKLDRLIPCCEGLIE